MATDWTSLRIEYVNGSMQYKELAEKHGLKEGTVRQRANREQWAEQRHALSRAVTESVTQAITEERIDELAAYNQADLSAAKRIREKALQMLDMAEHPNEVKALSGAVEVASKVARLALGVPTENSSVTTKELPTSIDEFIIPSS
jgi:hypothetical protein